MIDNLTILIIDETIERGGTRGSSERGRRAEEGRGRGRGGMELNRRHHMPIIIIIIIMCDTVVLTSVQGSRILFRVDRGAPGD